MSLDGQTCQNRGDILNSAASSLLPQKCKESIFMNKNRFQNFGIFSGGKDASPKEG